MYLIVTNACDLEKLFRVKFHSSKLTFELRIRTNVLAIYNISSRHGSTAWFWSNTPNKQGSSQDRRASGFSPSKNTFSSSPSATLSCSRSIRTKKGRKAERLTSGKNQEKTAMIEPMVPVIDSESNNEDCREKRFFGCKWFILNSQFINYRICIISLQSHILYIRDIVIVYNYLQCKQVIVIKYSTHNLIKTRARLKVFPIGDVFIKRIYAYK